MYNPEKILQQLRSERHAVQVKIIELERRVTVPNSRTPRVSSGTSSAKTTQIQRVRLKLVS